VTTTTIGSFWFVIVAAVVVIGTSYLVATILGLYVIKIKNPMDFCSLRISASFPNIVALPILIFPALCEYPVVHEAFGVGSSPAELYRSCTEQSNTMIFCYFFSWSFLFYSIGQGKLLTAANQRLLNESIKNRAATLAETEHTEGINSNTVQGEATEESEGEESKMSILLRAFWLTTRETLIKTFTSPGFLAMLLGFVTACIPPLQDALFSSGGALRFIGAAIETLGIASSSISTMVVAASLVPNKIVVEEPDLDDDEEEEGEAENDDKAHDEPTTSVEELLSVEEQSQLEPQIEQPQRNELVALEESPIMADPNFGPRMRRQRMSASSMGHSMHLVIRRRSSLVMERIKRSDRNMWKLHLWFILSRLIISPALISAGLVGMDCAGWLTDVPDLAKLVVVINSALPGALVVVILLKSQPALSESAAVVAKVYLPSYLLSIVTIAAWASVGLYISLPNEDGTSFCGK
jgi:predicted permease